MRFTGIVDLLASERGVFALVLLAVCSILYGTGRMTTEQWISYTQWIGVTLIASKTITTALETWTKRPQPAAVAATDTPTTVVATATVAAAP